MNTGPITSQKEADELKRTLATRTANVLRIPIDEATRRVEGLLKSGVLERGSPHNPATQQAIEAFLSIPSATYAHLK